MKGFWYAAAVVIAFVAFLGWKEGLVRHGWEGHDACVYEKLRYGMPNDEAMEAIKPCSGSKAFDQWREGTKGGQGDDSGM